MVQSSWWIDEMIANKMEELRDEALWAAKSLLNTTLGSRMAEVAVEGEIRSYFLWSGYNIYMCRVHSASSDISWSSRKLA